jgi:hypothetical protein
MRMVIYQIYTLKNYIYGSTTLIISGGWPTVSSPPVHEGKAVRMKGSLDYVVSTILLQVMTVMDHIVLS